MQQRTPTVIGLAGASGGLGASTLAAAVAALAAGTGRAALLVDLAPNAGGLDQLVGCAHEPGQRWPAREAGMASLHSRDLPTWRGVRVLSQHGAVLPAPDLGPVAAAAVSNLAREHDVTVLDLPRADHPSAPRWFGLCATVVQVAGTTPPQVAAALVAQVLQPVAHGVVLRQAAACGLAPADVAGLLGLPLLHHLVDDPAVPRAVLDQCWPGSSDGPVREAAAAVLSAGLRPGVAAA